jgi:ketosteroid isomerase-like protein
MKTAFRVALLALLLLTGTGRLYARSDPASAKSELEARYAALKSAMADRDAQALSSLLAPDCVSEDASGKTVPGSEMIRQISASPKDPKLTSETTLLSVNVEGDIATVEQRYQMTTTRVIDGAIRKMDMMALSTDTWVKSGGTWLLRKTVTRETDLKLDGKLVSHREHPAGN